MCQKFSKVLKIIKPNTKIDMTEFFLVLKKKKKNVNIYPIYENWLDAGDKNILKNVINNVDYRINYCILRTMNANFIEIVRDNLSNFITDIIIKSFKLFNNNIYIISVIISFSG